MVRMSRESLVDNPEIERKAIEIIKKAGIPCSIQYVAYHLGLPWHTTRAILFRLMAEGKVKGMNTTKSWIFSSGDNDEE